MTISHQGTDAAAFDYVRIQAASGFEVAYECRFNPILIDDEQYLSSSDCYQL